MTTKAFIKQADLRRMADVAKREGVIVEVEVDGRIFRVRPDHGETHGAAVTQPSNTFKSSWADVGPEPRLGAGGYPIITDPMDPVKKYYDQLGFDAATMGQDDMDRLVREADDRWAAAIPGTPLNKRERVALSQLAEHGSGKKIPCEQIKNCGPETEERLVARGYLKTFPQKKYPDRVGYLMLTDTGFHAWKQFSTE